MTDIHAIIAAAKRHRTWFSIGPDQPWSFEDSGAKPEKVCHWILELLNFQPGDTCDDLYPGTGVMGRVASNWALTG